MCLPQVPEGHNTVMLMRHEPAKPGIIHLKNSFCSNIGTLLQPSLDNNILHVVIYLDSQFVNLVFSDNRSERKLVEAYDKHTSQYAVKHADWDKSKSTHFGIDYHRFR